MKNLTILNIQIRTLDGLYSLNDFHKASGEENKHRPSLFIRSEQTQDLIKEINCSNSDLSTKTILAHKSYKGGLNAGVWACEELVLSYAMWISPKFHLIVLRAFLAMHKQQCQPKQLALPEPTISIEFTADEWRRLINVWTLFTRYEESVSFLLNAVAPFAHGHTISSAQFNHSRAKPALLETVPTIKKIMEKLPKAVKFHESREQITHKYGC